MSRIRTVKPELFRHEGLYEAETESGLPLRLAYIALFTQCDREGRFRWRPRAMKLDCLPWDDGIDFARVLDALLTRGFIRKYTVGGEEYGYIPSWHRHQTINNRESASTLPSPAEEEPTQNSTGEARVNDASTTPLCRAQGEGKGKEGKARQHASRKSALPADFAVSDRVRQWAEQKGHGQLDQHLEHFIGWAKSKGHTYADWDQTFQNAIRDNWAGVKAPSEPANQFAGVR